MMKAYSSTSFSGFPGSPPMIALPEHQPRLATVLDSTSIAGVGELFLFDTLVYLVNVRLA